MIRINVPRNVSTFFYLYISIVDLITSLGRSALSHCYSKTLLKIDCDSSWLTILISWSVMRVDISYRMEWLLRITLIHTCMNSMKLVILFHSLYWPIHTKDESKRGIAFAFIFGVNWLWRCGVTESFGVFFFHEWKCNGMTSFMEFMSNALSE